MFDEKSERRRKKKSSRDIKQKRENITKTKGRQKRGDWRKRKVAK